MLAFKFFRQLEMECLTGFNLKKFIKPLTHTILFLKGCSILVFLLSATPSLAQEFELYGYITDNKTDECISSALISVDTKIKKTTSSESGFYYIRLEKGEYNISVSKEEYIGKTIKLNISKDTSVDIGLVKEILLKEVTVSSNNILKNIEKNQTSLFTIPTRDLQVLPSFMGETDIIKSTQLVTGVQSGNDGSTGFYVRGGGPDQNLVLMDGIPLYSINHMAGLFSVFNSDAISTVNLYKGGFPARFGGRLSSVLDIRLKEGDMKEYHGNVSLGLIFSKISLGGPIIKDKLSFDFSARRTYADLIYKALRHPLKLPGKNGRVFFYDYNAKLTYNISNNSRVSFGTFKGMDETMVRLTDDFTLNSVPYNEINDLKMNWSDFTAYLKWTKTYSSRMIGNISLAYNRYLFNVDYKYYLENENKNKANDFDFDYQSGIRDIHFSIDYNIAPTDDDNIKLGLNFTTQYFEPEDETLDLSSPKGVADIFGKSVKTGFIYMEDDVRVTEGLSLNLGLHLSGAITDNRFYHTFEPRFSLRYLINDHIALKTSFAQMSQYIHLLSTSTISSPVDLWVPITKKIGPEKSSQGAVGLTFGLTDAYELGFESYYKRLLGVIEYKEGEKFIGSTLGWENRIEKGTGHSYGTEILLRKTAGKAQGWLGYTLSWSNRQFDNINAGKTFPYRYDRRHDLNVVIIYNFNKNINASLTWIYGTGNAVSLNSKQFTTQVFPFLQDGQERLTYYETRNNYRMPPYHRLDVSFNFQKEKKHGTRTWKIGLFNAYNHQNPFFLFFGYDNSQKIASTDPDGKIVYNSKKVLKQFSLLPILPSVSYSYKF
jgi:hypothetical protein